MRQGQRYRLAVRICSTVPVSRPSASRSAPASARRARFGLPRLAVGAGFFMKPVTLLLPCFQVGAVFGLGRQFVPARIPVPFPPEPPMSLEIRKSSRGLLGQTRNAV